MLYLSTAIIGNTCVKYQISHYKSAKVTKALALRIYFAYISLNIEASHVIQQHINRPTLWLPIHQFLFLGMTAFLQSSAFLLWTCSSVHTTCDTGLQKGRSAI